MDRGSISLRYAKALMIYASAHKAVDAVYKDCTALSAAYAHYAALRRVMDDRLIPAAKKEELMRVCCPGVSKQFARFFTLVLEKRRAALLQTMCLDYIQLVRQAEGLIDVQLTTAVELDKATRELFEKKLGQMTGKRVTLHTTTDRSLIGGYVVRWDTYRLDQSVTGRLKKIEMDLRNDGQFKG